MRKVIRLQHSTLFLIGLLLAPSCTPAYASPYVVGAGDELYVDFPLKGSPSDLQPLGGNGLTLVIVGESVFFRYSATVAPNGSISLPSIDTLIVEGMTLEQVRDAITSHLKSLSLRTPISVILARPNSQAFTVTGEVNKPGRFVYERPTTLMEALAIAGGTTDHAQIKRILLFRPNQASLTYNITEKQLAQNGLPPVIIQPLDTVVVPRRWYTPDNTLIFILLALISTGATLYVATKY